MDTNLKMKILLTIALAFTVLVTQAQTATQKNVDSAINANINTQAAISAVSKFTYYGVTPAQVTATINSINAYVVQQIALLKFGTPPPVIIPPVTPPPGVYTDLTTQDYYQNKTGITIQYRRINIKNGGAICMLLQGCKNVLIKNCIIENSTNDGIQLTNCSNVEITNCFITNVKAGINAIKGSAINVHDNQFLNMNGPFPSGNFVQLNNINGGGIKVQNNHCEDIAGVAKSPEDGISIYQCNGLPGDSVMVTGNWIRGGQIKNTSGGGAGIVLGDVGGSYQVGRNNIVINGGFVGMQVQGGTHIKMDHNIIYSSPTGYSNCGLCYGNYSKAPSSDIYMGYNQVKFFQSSGKEMDAWVDPKAGYTPAGWSTNILKANIDPTKLLPAVIITVY